MSGDLGVFVNFICVSVITTLSLVLCAFTLYRNCSLVEPSKQITLLILLLAVSDVAFLVNSA